MMKKIFYGMGAVAICIAGMIEDPLDAFIKVAAMGFVCLAAGKALDIVERRAHGKRYMDIRATSDR